MWLIGRPLQPSTGHSTNLPYLVRVPDRVGGLPEAGCSHTVSSDQSRAGTGSTSPDLQRNMGSVSYPIHPLKRFYLFIRLVVMKHYLIFDLIVITDPTFSFTIDIIINMCLFTLMHYLSVQCMCNREDNIAEKW